MNNGDVVFLLLSEESKKRLGLVMNRGPQAMPSLSGYARKGQTKDLMELINSTGQDSLSRKSIRADANKQQRKALRILEGYSMNELAELDKLGIKVIGIDYEIDHLDREWAK